YLYVRRGCLLQRGTSGGLHGRAVQLGQAAEGDRERLPVTVVSASFHVGQATPDRLGKVDTDLVAVPAQQRVRDRHRGRQRRRGRRVRMRRDRIRQHRGGDAERGGEHAAQRLGRRSADGVIAPVVDHR